LRFAGLVAAVCSSGVHEFSKAVRDGIQLLAGLGVEGDAHQGVTVKHRSRVRRDPTQPNLRQVHLLQGELHDELAAAGFHVAPGVMGENITTRGLDLLGLAKGTRLHLGEAAVVEVTGLRNPCKQLDDYQPGLLAAVLDRDTDGRLVRKAGVMAVVLPGGRVRPLDPVRVELPLAPREVLDVV
jgi:MOSC domain-containing protein YiiM